MDRMPPDAHAVTEPEPEPPTAPGPYGSGTACRYDPLCVLPGAHAGECRYDPSPAEGQLDRINLNPVFTGCDKLPEPALTAERRQRIQAEIRSEMADAMLKPASRIADPLRPARVRFDPAEHYGIPAGDTLIAVGPIPRADTDWVRERFERPAHGGYPDTTPRPVPERSPSVDAVLEQARHANGRRITGMVIDEEVPDPGAGEQQGMYHAGVQKAIQQRLDIATVPCWCGNAITKHEWQAGVHLSRNNCPHTYRGAPLLGRDPWQLCAKALGNWQCSRDRNHEGPCAAYPSPHVAARRSRQNDDRAKALRALLDDAAQLLEAWAAHGRPPSPTTLRRLAKAMRYASIPNESP